MDLQLILGIHILIPISLFRVYKTFHNLKAIIWLYSITQELMASNLFFIKPVGLHQHDVYWHNTKERFLLNILDNVNRTSSEVTLTNVNVTMFSIFFI